MFRFVCQGLDFSHKLDTPSQPTEDYSKHLHCFNEILFLVGGDISYTVEGACRKLEKGDLVFIRSGKYHFASVNAAVRYERYVLKFPDGVLPPFLVKKLETLHCFLGNAAQHSLLFRQLDGYFAKYGGEELAALFTCELIRLLILLCGESAARPRAEGTLISEIVGYIDEHLFSALTLEDIAARFHFSVSYTANEFRRVMKIPLMRYVRTKKMIAAHKLIVNGEKKSSVAELLGFENYSTFYRQYKKFLELYLHAAPD